MPNITIPADYAENPSGFALGEMSPEIGRAAGEFIRAVYQSLHLPLRVAEAARYRTAQINGCLVCQSFRAGDHLDSFLESIGGDTSTSLVARGGERPDEAFYQAIDGNWQSSDKFSEKEKLAIEYAEKMGENPRDLGHDEEFWSRMRRGMSDREINDLTLAVACWMGMGRYTHVLGFDTVCVAGMSEVAQAAE